MAKKPNPSTEDEKIVERAHQEFEVDYEYESESRVLFKADLRFANGDPDNKFQWDADYVKERDQQGRPCLTINKIKQHNRQITNEARQNKPTIRVLPVDSGADKKTAEIFNGIIRHIETNSNADTAYDLAEDFAVDAGIGYWRIVTEYASDDSFDQEIYIEPIKNPLNVLLDSRIQRPDGSDARRGFVFRDMDKKDFERDYPSYDQVSWPMESGDNWLSKDTIRVAEYFKIEDDKDTLYALPDGSSVKKSELEEVDVKALEAGVKTKEVKKREVKLKKVKWYLIAGDQILERKDWLGIYIPIVRVIGEEKEIDGKLDRKGHTRAMKDAQRMYNYNSSASIEYGALQTKTPIVGAAQAFEGYEKYWQSANTENLPYLPFNHVDETGNPIPRPERMNPPAPAQLFLQGMATASNEMNMSSGQYEAQFGNNPTAQSGVALNALQRKGDVATFHFIDNVSRAVRYTGKILIDLIPKIYDTQRIIRILGEDDSEELVKLNPEMEQAYAERQNAQTGEIEKIFNPTVGRYDVAVTVGASYTTKRQEAFAALTEMASRNPQLMQIAGDLIMKAADFPMANELAERLEKTLPPEIREEKAQEVNEEAEQVKIQATEIIGQLQTQLEQAGQIIQEREQALNEVDMKAQDNAQKLAIEAEKLDIERYKAETDRLKVELDAVQKTKEQDNDSLERLDMLEQAIALIIESNQPPENTDLTEPAQAGFLLPSE